MKEYKGFKKDPTEPGYEEYKTLVEDTRRNLKGLKLQLAITTGILEHAICMMKSTKPPKEETQTPDTADTDHKTPKTSDSSDPNLEMTP